MASGDAVAPGVDLDVIFAGEVPMPHGYVFRPQSGSRLMRMTAALGPGGGSLRSPLLAFAIRHPRAGTILIDTGLHPEASASLRRDFGLPMSLLFRELKPAPEPYEAQLRGLGIEAGEVERVVMTHLHVDHTSGMRLLPRAEFVCSAEEWAAARGQAAAGRGYVSHHLPPESRTRLIDFDREGDPYGPFKKTLDLLGDGSVRLIFTPGHTPGHLSVLLRLAGGRRVLLVGDAAYTLRSIREQILPLLTVGDQLYLSTLRQLKEYSESETETILVPSHDPTAWHALRDGSAAEESRDRSVAGTEA